MTGLLHFLRQLTGAHRQAHLNRLLGVVLAVIAGAINAGGFLAVNQYTSHLTGVVSSMADHIVLGHMDLVLDGVGAMVSFLLGAMSCAVMVNFARRRRLASEFALPLLLEGLLLWVFGLMGVHMAHVEGLFVPITVSLLCFVMGLQNALITKVSHAEIRTTHVTGIVTDLGIELGKWMYWNRSQVIDLTHGAGRVVANRQRLKLLSALLLGFFGGAVSGAYAFKQWGFSACYPFAGLLIALAAAPVLDDLAHLKARRFTG